MRTILLIIGVHIGICIGFLFPLVQGIATHIPAGDGSHDGYQFLWNLWWVRTAMEGSDSLLYTHLLFAPHGTPLALHSLSASNGFLSLPIQYFVNDHHGLIAALNILTLGHFAFLSAMIHALCRKLECSHVIGFTAGILIAYLPYRIHHLHHLNLLSTGWLVLALYSLIELKERIKPMIPAALLTLSTTSLIYADHEQSLCLGIIAIAFCVTYRAIIPQKSLLFSALATLGLTLPMWITLLSFPPGDFMATSGKIFSTNIPSLLFPFSIENMGIKHEDPYVESQVGWVFWVFVFLGAQQFSNYGRLLLGLAVLFGLLSFGNTLQLGETTLDIPLPFDLMHNGWLSMARAPVRFLPISLLLVVLVCAQGWKNRTRWTQWFMLLYVLTIRYPQNIPMETVHVPPSVFTLSYDTRPYAIWNTKESYTSIQKDMFFQTIHAHPISGGYTARVWKPAYLWKQQQSTKPIQEMGNNGFGLSVTSGTIQPQQWITTPFGQTPEE